MTKQYIAQERVRHSVTRQYYDAGQAVPIDHLSPEQLASLVERGVFRVVEVSAPTPVTAKRSQPAEAEKPARATSSSSSANKSEKRDKDNG